MGYREKWFNANSGIRLPFKTGYWYRCVKCNGYFRKSDIEIDHRIPLRKGGTNDLWNLQPLCRHCNRSKRDRQSNSETAETLIRATVHGGLGTAVSGMLKRKAKDVLHIKYKRK